MAVATPLLPRSFAVETTNRVPLSIVAPTFSVRESLTAKRMLSLLEPPIEMRSYLTVVSAEVSTVPSPDNKNNSGKARRHVLRCIARG